MIDTSKLSDKNNLGICQIYIYDMKIKPQYTNLLKVSGGSYPTSTDDDENIRLLKLKIYGAYLIYLNPLMDLENFNSILYEIACSFMTNKPQKNDFTINECKLEEYALNHGKYIMNLDY